MNDSPPQWLVRLVQLGERRLKSARGRLDAGPDETEHTDEEPADQRRDQSMKFEQRWGIYYLPVAFLIVVWLVVMANWGNV